MQGAQLTDRTRRPCYASCVQSWLTATRWAPGSAGDPSTAPVIGDLMAGGPSLAIPSQAGSLPRSSCSQPQILTHRALGTPGIA